MDFQSEIRYHTSAMSARTMEPYVKDLLDGHAALFGEGGPAPARLESGGLSRLLMLSGENAGGKSLFGRLYAQRSREAGLRCIDVTMARRTAGAGASGLERAMVYGSNLDDANSSGCVSLRSVMGAVRTCRDWTDPHRLLFDEPDVGLSESYQSALGQWLAPFLLDLPRATAGRLLITHSRPMVSAILDHAAAHVLPRPHLMRIGDDLRPTAEWIERGPLPRTAEDLEALAAGNDARRRAASLAVREIKAAAGREWRAP